MGYSVKGKIWKDAVLGVRPRKRPPQRFRMGLTRAEYDGLLRAQDGVCAICGWECSSGRRLAVDHDHRTGKVRGLLCTKCNMGIGMFWDETDLLHKAADYLRANEME